MVFNDRGAVVFPAKRQHRETSAEGTSYGNGARRKSLDAMLRLDAIEIWCHCVYDDREVNLSERGCSWCRNSPA